MSDVDKLPTWAATAAEPGGNATVPPTPTPGEPTRPGGGRRLPLIILGLLAMAGMAVLGYWFAGRNSDATVTADGTNTSLAADASAGDGSADATESETATATGSETGSETDTAAEPTTTAPATTVAEEPTTSAPETTDAAADAAAANNRDGEIRHAVFRSGQLYLRGRVPSQAVADEIVLKAGAVVGPDNVHDEYVIDADVAAAVASPLYVEDVVLFDFNSVKIESAFLPILDLGTLLLVQNPNVKITVVARTDAVGSEATNLEVSEQRAQAVINYWVRKGIDPSRLTADGRGESDASEDDDEQTAALHRRAEFIISGLLDG